MRVLRALRRLSRLFWLGRWWLRDRFISSYSPVARASVPALPLVVEVPESAGVVLGQIAGMTRSGIFDLLGSGWCDHRLKVPLRVNRANKARSGRIAGLLEPDYQRLDWELDCVSGYRWSVAEWSRLIRYGEVRGVDVKRPWELSRMHHLAQLALADMAGSGGHVEGTDSVNALAFRNQVIDFIAANPPRYGVDWRCTMDVAIRAANWVVAYRLFQGVGVVFEPEFESLFTASLRDHGRHIVSHLEWDPTWRGNHYLADIVGLLFVAAALPADSESDAWLGFAVGQLVVEVERQFYADGANFEASTGYHRLSAEMVVFATALVLGLTPQRTEALRRFKPRDLTLKLAVGHGPVVFHQVDGIGQSPFPAWFFERIERMACFTMAVTKPDGQVMQLGDHDSGRFLKLQPTGRFLSVAALKQGFSNLSDWLPPDDRAEFFHEGFLDHRHLVSAIAGLLPRDSFIRFAAEFTIDRAVIQVLAGGRCYAGDVLVPESGAAGRPAVRPSGGDVLELPLAEGSTEGLNAIAFNDFGLYIWRSERLFVAIRCGPVGQDGYGGHGHNDALSVECWVDGKALITDPGTYVYTPEPDERQRYRSVAAHFAPQASGQEPGSLSLGLWRLGDEAQAQCHQFDHQYFIGSHRGYGPTVWRQLRIEPGRLVIQDWADGELQLRDLNSQYASLDGDGCSQPFCPGYGVRHA